MEEVERDKHWDETPEPRFEDQNFDPPIYITLARIYDMLTIIALAANPAGTKKIIDLHEKGHLKGPEPTLVFDVEQIKGGEDDV